MNLYNVFITEAAMVLGVDSARTSIREFIKPRVKSTEANRAYWFKLHLVHSCGQFIPFYFLYFFIAENSFE